MFVVVRKANTHKRCELPMGTMTMLVVAGPRKLAASAAGALFPTKSHRLLLATNFSVLRQHHDVGKWQEPNHRFLRSSKSPHSQLGLAARNHSSGNNKDARQHIISSKNSDKDGEGTRKSSKLRSDASCTTTILPPQPGGGHRGDGNLDSGATNTTRGNRKRFRNSRAVRSNVITQSDYYYSYPPSGICTNRSESKQPAFDKFGSRSQVVALPAVDATVLLDPKKFSKTSSKATMTHGVSRSIDGADAARRILRGKKDFVHAVRSQLLHSGGKRQGKTRNGTPAKSALLQGHGVPPQLIQHFVDMADTLLVLYGNAAECSFHNYNYNQLANGTGGRRGSAQSMPQSPTSKVQIPEIIRVRTSDSSNQLSKWPPPRRNSSSQELPSSDDLSSGAWNENLALYLTAMERIACRLATALPREHDKQQIDDVRKSDKFRSRDDADDDDDFTSSTALFPASSSLRPDWNVDILRGSYFDLHNQDTPGLNGNDNTRKPSSIQPTVPIVEWIQGHHPSTLGHVLIRIQGQSAENNAFSSATVRLDTQSENALIDDITSDAGSTDSTKDISDGPEQCPRQPVTLIFDACFRTHRARQANT